MPRGGHDIPMSGTHLKGTHEVVTKGVDPTIKTLVGTRDASHWTKDPRSWVRISGEAKGTQWE